MHGIPIEDAFIELGLKGEDIISRPSSKNSSMQFSLKSEAISDGSNNSLRISQTLENIDKLKRESHKFKQENDFVLKEQED